MPKSVDDFIFIKIHPKFSLKYCKGNAYKDYAHKGIGCSQNLRLKLKNSDFSVNQIPKCWHPFLSDFFRT